jgi:phosphatidylinositol kinase/protein kinase (PI-3  family)
MAETHKVRILELSQVSPYLHSMKNTPIGLPGQNEHEESCFIDSFGTNVIVLPTKTKPKKLDLKGTDGKKYSYLFKGLEDLHLDERIMQLLTATNGLLSENGATALRGMRARTYAVIPLSDHSGMIQWVNDATPFFALFKKWQKRESTAHMLLSNDKPNEAYIQSLLQRPTEQFTTKIASILKSAGLRVTANRRYWPKEVLKKVYLELVKETPGDLLQKEIYYSSSSATEWFKKSTSFARSLAVTSMIGYIIGLGDRHLDNILVDFRSGEVIHIDYNVCFEKGKRLRVPELVPYRLTQNLYGALGITGADGQFKAAAEETLRVLRNHKEVLITLLDAFVYDPLVDWEGEAMETGHRQMMELQANLSLVATRVIKKQVEQDKERKIILGSLSGLRHNLHQWQESMLIEAETLNAEDGSDDEEHGLDHDSLLSPTGEGESSTFMGRLPVYLLREVKTHLTNVYSLVRNSQSSVEGIAPLLESIIIIETDADNELRPAQNSAKVGPYLCSYKFLLLIS